MTVKRLFARGAAAAIEGEATPNPPVIFSGRLYIKYFV